MRRQARLSHQGGDVESTGESGQRAVPFFAHRSEDDGSTRPSSQLRDFHALYFLTLTGAIEAP
eukprot:7579236-Pyramimonas_sp.AAC.1